MRFRTSNEKVVSVTQSGKITAKSAGTVTITVSCVSNPQVKAICKVTVKGKVTLKISGKSKAKRGKSIILTSSTKNYIGKIKWSLDKKSKKLASLSRSEGAKVKLKVKKNVKKKAKIIIKVMAGNVTKKKIITVS